MAQYELKTFNDYKYDEVISAMQKCIRKGDEYQALWWSLELVESGYDLAVWKRLCIIACEDVGLADESAVILINNLAEMWERMRKVEKGRAILPEKNILALAILKLCRTMKNREADDLTWLIYCKRIGKDPKTGEKVEPERLKIPDFCRDGHTEEGKKKLRDEAQRTGEPFLFLWNKEFYEGVARLNKPVELKDGQKNWMKEMAIEAGCLYEEYIKPIEA